MLEEQWKKDLAAGGGKFFLEDIPQLWHFACILSSPHTFYDPFYDLVSLIELTKLPHLHQDQLPLQL